VAVSIFSNDYYKTSLANDPDGFVNWMLDALRKGGRLIENRPEDVANGQPKYATYAQIYADLSANRPDIAQRLPSPQDVQQDPVNYKGVTGGDTFQQDEQNAASGTPAPAPAAPPTPAVDPNAEATAKTRMGIFNQLSSVLNDLGMGELFSMPSQGGDSAGMSTGGGTTGKPSGWLWDQIVAGTVNNSTELGIALEATPVWQRLYGGVINEQRKQAKGDPTAVHIMNPLEIAQYRQQANQLARQYNLPPDFYNDVHDWDQLMVGQVDPTELQHRISLAWNDVANADPNVSRAFDSYFGTSSASQQAAFFLDPTHSMANLDLAAKTAVIGGTGTRYGFGLQRPLAERIARNGVTQTAAEQQFGNLAQEGAFFRPNIGEGGDLTDEAVGGAFGVADNQQGTVADIERRKAERLSTTSRGSGGPDQTRVGVVGVGSGV
jgi:hypothetical protein